MNLSKRLRVVLLSALVFVILVCVVASQPQTQGTWQRLVGRKFQSISAGYVAPPPSFSGKPCPERPGTPLPSEVEGCNGNLNLSTRFPSLPFTLVYNSQSSRNEGYGVGWSLSVDPMIETTSDSTGVLITGNGTPIQLSFDSSESKWKPLYLVQFEGTIVRETAGWALSRADGTKEFYSPINSKKNKFVLTSVTSPTGILLTLSRDKNGALSQIRKNSKETISFSYKDLNLASIRDPADKTYSFLYDASGNLVQIIFPTNKSITMTYHSASSRLASYTDRQNRTIRFEYFPGAEHTTLSLVTDSKNSSTSYSYSSTSFKVSNFEDDITHHLGGFSRQTISQKGTSSEVFDSLYRLVRTKDAKGGTTTFSYYNSTPYIQNVTRPDGTRVSYELNSRMTVKDRL